MNRLRLVLSLLVSTPVFANTMVEKWRTHQLTFTTSTSVSNPFDTISSSSA
jgi:type III secretory pathway component EscR